MYINQDNFEKKIKNLKISKLPFKIFDPKVLDFFDHISNTILSKKAYKKYPDLISFGFWCRKNNLIYLKKQYSEIQIGRGIVFHISPSNVPLNFAYSLAFGLLAGNSNILRLPSVEFEQVKILKTIVNKVLKVKRFVKLKEYIALISYNRSDEISKKISITSDARMIWGGDETIKKFKGYETKPRCLDLTFSNRFSISLINSQIYSKKNELEKLKIAQNFVKDCYTMDQLGCSSPKALFWIGINKKKDIEKFWTDVNKILNIKNNFDLIKTNNKIYSIHKNIILSNNIFKLNKEKFKTVRINLLKKQKKFEIENFQAGYGTFIEIKIKKIKDLKNYISEKCQTVTQYGYESNEIKKIIIKNNFKGVDRIVKIGMAFEMTNLWDGYDIIGSLSRKISSI